jgi:hypothetical protein
LKYFKQKNPKLNAYTEVLWNWIGGGNEIPCSIDLDITALANRKIFIYAGNMGVAQGIKNLIDLAKAVSDQKDIGFIFVGRGSEVENLKKYSISNNLGNTLFFDEMSSTEVLALCRKCHVGMISLDTRHKSHNIPGKFLLYLKANLRILAIGNKGNDLEDIIKKYSLGFFTSNQSDFLGESQNQNLFNKIFSSEHPISIEKINEVLKIFNPQSTAIQIVDIFRK